MNTEIIADIAYTGRAKFGFDLEEAKSDCITIRIFNPDKYWPKLLKRYHRVVPEKVDGLSRLLFVVSSWVEEHAGVGKSFTFDFKFVGPSPRNALKIYFSPGFDKAFKHEAFAKFWKEKIEKVKSCGQAFLTIERKGEY
ncbi:hypothetical protein ACFL15_02445 [Patescibacteria group bacterium]